MADKGSDSIEKRSDGSVNEREYDEGSKAETATAHDSIDRKLLFKMDLYVLFPLMILYLISFLDRSNIGNAKLDGLTADLHVVGAQYNTALVLWFVGYILFEIPSQLVLKKLNPKVWLPTLTLVWGIVAICQGVVVNRQGLYAVRFFLGVTESGLFPGCVYVFSLYYPRKLRPFRVAFFFSGAALAGAFGGILAYGLGRIHTHSWKGWRFILVIEGALTVVIAALAYLVVPKYPQKAGFLAAPERARLLGALKKDSDSADNEPFNWRGVKQALTDPYCWGYALLFHGYSFVLYTLSLFSPTIIANLGYKSWQAQLLSTPPYVIAFIVTMVIVFGSFKKDQRAYFIVGAAVVAIIGYIILISTHRAGSQYVGLIFAVSGVYSGNALVLSWPSENISSQTKRATGLGLQISVGNLGAVVGVLLYRPSLNGHLFRTPNIVALGYITLAATTALTLRFFMARENAKRDAQAASSGERHLADDEEEVLRLGDRHPTWRYQL